MRFPFILVIFLLFAVSCSHPAQPMEETTRLTIRSAIPDSTLSDLIVAHNVNPSAISILISKSAYTLAIRSGSETLKIYPVVFGPNPLDDKRMEGDGCTPEGAFSIRALYPHTKWSKFLWIDYPTTESYKKFEAAKQAGEIPQSATIGGEIGIHGVPDNNDKLIDDKVNWTAGCISLKTVDIEEIYSVIKVGTSVKIIK